jgi:hypothetical protein
VKLLCSNQKCIQGESNVRQFQFRYILLIAFSATLLYSNVSYGDVIADSLEDWSVDGIIGENGWFNGWRNFTEDNGGDYNYEEEFLFFINDGSGVVDYIGEGHVPFGNSWTGDHWRLQGGDLGATGGPWTILESEFAHPNGTNSAAGGVPEEHWTIRRWEASIAEPMNLELTTSLAAQNTNCGNGTTVHLYQNGNLLHSLTTDSAEAVEDSYVGRVLPGDLIDLALTPEGVDGERGDSCDGSLYRLTISESFVDTPSCDFDGDGLCTGSDIDQLMNEAATGGTDTDLTGNGIVDNADRDEWLAVAGIENGFAGPLLAGDSNLDGTVNSTDLNNLALSWQKEDVFDWTGGNYSADGSLGVNSSDLNALALNWQMSTPLAAESVPEPNALSLMFLAIIAYTVCCRTRN